LGHIRNTALTDDDDMKHTRTSHARTNTIICKFSYATPSTKLMLFRYTYIQIFRYTALRMSALEFHASIFIQ